MEDRDDVGAELAQAAVEVAGKAQVDLVADVAHSRVVEVRHRLVRACLGRAVVDDDGHPVAIDLADQAGQRLTQVVHARVVRDRDADRERVGLLGRGHLRREPTRILVTSTKFLRSVLLGILDSP